MNHEVEQSSRMRIGQHERMMMIMEINISKVSRAFIIITKTILSLHRHRYHHHRGNMNSNDHNGETKCKWQPHKRWWGETEGRREIQVGPGWCRCVHKGHPLHTRIISPRLGHWCPPLDRAETPPYPCALYGMMPSAEECSGTAHKEDAVSEWEAFQHGAVAWVMVRWWGACNECNYSAVW